MLKQSSSKGLDRKINGKKFLSNFIIRRKLSPGLIMKKVLAHCIKMQKNHKSRPMFLCIYSGSKVQIYPFTQKVREK